MRLTERKLALTTGIFFAVAMTNISQNGDQIVANLAKMAERPKSVTYTAAGAQAGTAAKEDAGPGLAPLPEGGGMSLDLRDVQGDDPVAPAARRKGTPELQGVQRHSDYSRPTVPLSAGFGNAALHLAGHGLPSDSIAPQADLPRGRLDLSTRLAALGGGVMRPPSDAELNLSPYGTPCSVTLSATPEPAAMVALTLDAPCHPRQRIEVSHAGLRFAARTSALGGYHVNVPALTEQALYAVRFSTGQTASVLVRNTHSREVERVVLQWTGRVDLDLHALEFGAGENGAGHVWAGAPRSAVHALRTGGGFLTQLGDADLDDPARAEIYTLTPGENAPSGVVRLLVEASGDTAACDRSVSARTLRSTAGSTLETVDIQFRMPPCGEAGQTLLLKNAVQDLKITRN